MWNQIDYRINSALNRVRRAFRAVLKRTDSSGKVQTVQAGALAGEKLQDNELFQHYGFTSCPLPGTMAIVLPLNGSTSHGIVIATEHGGYRLKNLKPGEVAIYTDEGASIIMKRGKIIEVNCDEYIVNTKKYNVKAEAYSVGATQKASFETPLLSASNDISDGKSTMNELREVYDDHDHEHGSDAGTTQKPNQKM